MGVVGGVCKPVGVTPRGAGMGAYPPVSGSISRSGNGNSFTYVIPAIVTGLKMSLLHIHMSTLYIHGMTIRKQGKLLHLALHH